MPEDPTILPNAPLSVPEDPSFELVPPEPAPTPEEAIAGAIAQAIPAIQPVQGVEPIPLGMSWLFDFKKNRMVRNGSAAMPVFGVDAVKMWAQMALRTARYAYAVFSDQFGFDDPESLVGALNVTELLADFARRTEEALLVHDRITAVEGFLPAWDPVSRSVIVPAFTLVLDNQQRVALTDSRVTLAGGR